MTQLMGRPALDLPDDLRSRPVVADVLAGAGTALLALSVIAVPVLGLWVLTPYGDVTARGALRLSCAVWLLGHGGPFTRGPAGAPLTLTPLLLTAVSAVLLRRAAARVPYGAAGPRSLLPLGTGYLGVAALATAECSGPDAVLRADPLPDLAAVAVVVAAGLGWGRCRVHGMPRLPLPAAVARRLRGRTPPAGWAAAAGRTAAAWLAGTLAGGGLLLAAAVLSGRAGQSADGIADRLAGVLGLLLACALLLPNALLWAVAYALGPGFAAGTGTLVSPFGTRLGALPDFPLFAVVPSGPAGPGHLILAGVLPLAAGVVPALMAGRAAAGRTTGRAWSLPATAAAALAAALLAGAATGAAGWLSGGALAAGRMSALGPVPWRVGLAAAGACAAVVLPGARVARLFSVRRDGGAEAPAPPADGLGLPGLPGLPGRQEGRGAAAAGAPLCPAALRARTAPARRGLHALVVRLSDPRTARGGGSAGAAEASG